MKTIIIYSSTYGYAKEGKALAKQMLENIAKLAAIINKWGVRRN